MKTHTLVFMIVVSICLSAPALAAPPTLALGSPAPDFSLKGFTVDTSGEAPRAIEKNYSLNDFAAADVLVLIFTCNHCPTAQAYEERLVQLVDDYRDKSVAIAAITSNDPLAVRLDELGYTDLGDSYEDTQVRALEKRFNFPYLYDGDHQAAAQVYGPAATPHVFVFDRARTLRYTGRIDNGEDPREVTKQETRAAIDALLAGRAPDPAQTRTFGCSTKWAEKRAAAKASLEKWSREKASLESIDAAGIKGLRKNDTQKLRLINLWATWCPACVVEFPELITINRMYRKRDFEMVTLCLDRPNRREQALAFLQGQAASCRNYIFSEQDRDALAEALDPDWNGALPHTLLIAPGGEIIYRHTGMIDPLEVKRAVVNYVGRYFFKP
jgi:thiol-disulfide isomerase/thioredoxin